MGKDRYLENVNCAVVRHLVNERGWTEEIERTAEWHIDCVIYWIKCESYLGNEIGFTKQDIKNLSVGYAL